jgi:hypothetical protein
VSSDLLTIEYPGQLTGDDVDYLAGVLDAAEIDADLRPAEARKGGTGLEPWHLLVILPLTSYVTALGELAAKRTWEAITTVARRVADRRPPGRAGGGTLVLEERSQHLSFSVGADALDDPEALQEMAELLRNGPARGTSYRWDGRGRRWVVHPAGDDA